MSTSPVQERLYKEAVLRETRINELKEDLFKVNCPFKPITNTYTATNSSKKTDGKRGSVVENKGADEMASPYRPTTIHMVQKADLEREKMASGKSSLHSLKQISEKVANQRPSKQDSKECDFSFRESLKSTAANSTSFQRNSRSRTGLSPKNSVQSSVQPPSNQKENGDPRKKLPKATPLALSKPQKASVAMEEEYCPTFGNYKLMRFN